MSHKTCKAIEFDFEFQYSDKGQFAAEQVITLQAPSFADFGIHTTMTGYAKAAEVGTAVALSAFRREDRQDLSSVAEETPASVESDAQMAERVIGVYAMGLGSDKFPAFMDHVRKILTNNPRLARVGETNQPIVDDVWRSIADKGGMDAINLVIAGFAGFFLTAAPSRSQNANGADSPTTSPSAPVLQ